MVGRCVIALSFKPRWRQYRLASHDQFLRLLNLSQLSDREFNQRTIYAC